MSATALKRLAIGLFLLDQVAHCMGRWSRREPDRNDRCRVSHCSSYRDFEGRQVAARVRNTGTASPLRDQHPDVLYLRSFGMDASTMRRKLMAGLSTEEEDLRKPLVRLRRPDRDWTAG